MSAGADQAWVRLLRETAAAIGAKAAAEAIGYSRGAVSGILNGNYAGNWDRVREAVETRLTAVDCPYLDGQRIGGAECLAHQARPEPQPGHPDYWHVRACRACRVGVGKAPKAGAA